MEPGDQSSSRTSLSENDLRSNGSQGSCKSNDALIFQSPQSRRVISGESVAKTPIRHSEFCSICLSPMKSSGLDNCRPLLTTKCQVRLLSSYLTNLNAFSWDYIFFIVIIHQHTFHSCCLEEVRNHHCNSCPLCRQQLSPKPTVWSQETERLQLRQAVVNAAARGREAVRYVHLNAHFLTHILQLCYQTSFDATNASGSLANFAFAGSNCL